MLSRMKRWVPSLQRQVRMWSGRGGLGGGGTVDLSQSFADSGNLGEASERFLHLLPSLVT